MKKKSSDDMVGEAYDEFASTDSLSVLQEDYVRPAGVKRFVIKKTESELLLIYSPKNGAAFVDEAIQNDGECRVAGGVFVFRKEDVKDFGSNSIGSRTFIMARIVSGRRDYYLMSGMVLDIPHNVLFYKDIEINMDWFTPWDSGARLSVFQKISRLIDEDIVIGGHDDKAIPYEYWERVVKQFPGKTEVAHYVESRIESLLKEYLPTIKRGDSLLQRHLENVKKQAPQPKRKSDWGAIDAYLNTYEVGKYRILCDCLSAALDKEELSEHAWEEMILRFVLLLYPQYIYAKRQLVIHERLTNPRKKTKRQIDLALFNADGHLDLIETGYAVDAT